jgi:hypothetical protein
MTANCRCEMKLIYLKDSRCDQNYSNRPISGV